MGELSVALLFVLMFTIAWLAPVIDMGGEPGFNVDVFWGSVLVGLLASAAFVAARAAWRRSRG